MRSGAIRLRWLIVLVTVSCLFSLNTLREHFFSRKISGETSPPSPSASAKIPEASNGLEALPPIAKSGNVAVKRRLAMKLARDQGLSTYSFTVETPPPPIRGQ